MPICAINRPTMASKTCEESARRHTEDRRQFKTTEDLPDPEGGGETVLHKTSPSTTAKLRQTKSAIWGESEDNQTDQPPKESFGVTKGIVKEMVRLFDPTQHPTERVDLGDDLESCAKPAQVDTDMKTPEEDSGASEKAGSSKRKACEDKEQTLVKTLVNECPTSTTRKPILKSTSKAELMTRNKLIVPESAVLKPVACCSKDYQHTNASSDESMKSTRNSKRTENRSRSRSRSRLRQPSAESIPWDGSPPKREGPIASTTQPKCTRYSINTTAGDARRSTKDARSASRHRSSEELQNPQANNINDARRHTKDARSVSRHRSSEELQNLLASNIQPGSKTSKSLERLAPGAKSTRQNLDSKSESSETENNDPNGDTSGQAVVQHHETTQSSGWMKRSVHVILQLPHSVLDGLRLTVSVLLSSIWNRFPRWNATEKRPQVSQNGDAKPQAEQNDSPTPTTAADKAKNETGN